MSFEKYEDNLFSSPFKYFNSSSLIVLASESDSLDEASVLDFIILSIFFVTDFFNKVINESFVFLSSVNDSKFNLFST